MTLVTESGLEPGWRQRKKTATSDRIRASALRLFREQGYDATTVEQIAAAAGVSHMTFFRYFPTKEDVALSDSYDPLIASAIAATPASWPLVQRIRVVFAQGLRLVYEADRDALLAQNKLIISTPALRDRLWAQQIATQQLILQALGADTAGRQPSFTDRVTVAACLAAATTAILAWVENDGTPDLPDLVEQAFDTFSLPGPLPGLLPGQAASPAFGAAVGEDLAHHVAPRNAGDPAAPVGARARLVQAAQRSAQVRVPGRRAGVEHLSER
jgi:AcrR family transcriptional regulator